MSGGYHLQGSTESLGPGSSHSLPPTKPVRTHWKGSTQSLKSDRSKKGCMYLLDISVDPPKLNKQLNLSL
jgi:hypothetical protein